MHDTSGRNTSKWKHGHIDSLQLGYAQRILKRSGMESAKVQSMPMDCNLRLMQDAEPLTEPYHETVGCIIYI